MAENSIGEKTIRGLMGKNFLVPSYQRGYRWDRQQVEDLLNDIYAFANRKLSELSKSEFYCLQSIAVRKCNDVIKNKLNLKSDFDNNEWYEVVDGQQRITTIGIIISYLVNSPLYAGTTLKGEHGVELFNLRYETRQDSDDILKTLQKNATDDDPIDLYFSREAYKVIDNWFKTKPNPRKDKETIRDALISDDNYFGSIKIIWYELDENVDPIGTFRRINMGKIPLTNAELIKALFLQKRNFSNDGEIANLRQLEIAGEWDAIEYSLQNDDFWWFINNKEEEIPARIDFLFSLIYKIKQEGLTEKFEKKYGNDSFAPFRYFNEKFAEDIKYEKVKEEWDAIKSYFRSFEDWYNNPVWYHYIGFLRYCGKDDKGKDRDEDIIDIYNKYFGKKKDAFTGELISMIREKCKNIKCTKNGEKYNIELVYGKGDKQIRQILLLFNIESIVKQNKNINEFIIRFPFKHFKTKKQWDIEHIDSFTPNSIESKKAQIDWLEMAKNDIDELNPEQIQRIDKCIALLQPDFFSLTPNEISFEELYKEIAAIARDGNEDYDEELKNSIGNLTLLNAEINRSYGNKLFPSKRKKIIEKDRDGVFIPLCTKYVFLKYFDDKGYSRSKWGTDDMEKYQNAMGRCLEQFLKEEITNEADNE